MLAAVTTLLLLFCILHDTSRVPHQDVTLTHTDTNYNTSWLSEPVCCPPHGNMGYRTTLEVTTFRHIDREAGRQAYSRAGMQMRMQSSGHTVKESSRQAAIYECRDPGMLVGRKSGRQSVLQAKEAPPKYCKITNTTLHITFLTFIRLLI